MVTGQFRERAQQSPAGSVHRVDLRDEDDEGPAPPGPQMAQPGPAPGRCAQVGEKSAQQNPPHARVLTVQFALPAEGQGGVQEGGGTAFVRHPPQPPAAQEPAVEQLGNPDDRGGDDSLQPAGQNTLSQEVRHVPADPQGPSSLQQFRVERVDDGLLLRLEVSRAALRLQYGPAGVEGPQPKAP